MNEPSGPFRVTPTQITRLGAAFTPFVNALLRVEVAASGLSHALITTTYQETIGDEGVDAGLRRVVETRFIPAGDSAWQFKRGDLPPAKCKIELAKAAAALDVLRAGGKYRLVVGADINNAKVLRRRKALIEEAARLDIELADDSIEVLTASDLAEWAENRPSLAISQMIGGIRGSVEDFYEWSASSGAATKWVDSQERQTVAAEIHQLIETDYRLDLHIEGVSGLGKSRTVLEALRGQSYESLIVYARTADAFPPGLIRYLTGEDRVAILVVDDCDPKQHKNLAAAIPAGSHLRVITMGEPGPSRSITKALALPPLGDLAMAEVIRLNRPNLWPEASYFVVDQAVGNVRLALVLVEAIEREPRSSAARLITKDIIKTYITEALPDGISFLACCALALFTHVGYGEEKAIELELISTATGLSEAELRAGGRTLAELGLFSVRGKFRSVTPQPLAVYLASRGWEEFQDQIVQRLLPGLDLDFSQRLLQRAAEIGPSHEVLRLVDAILARQDLFGSLAAIIRGGFSSALTELAIIAHAKVSVKLTAIFDEVSDDDLRAAKTIWRDLVRALEKIAWYPDTFEQAAGALLRLAINKVAEYDNNASDAWCTLFGVMLPNTSAPPEARMAYLMQVSDSPDPRVRMLAVRASADILHLHESVMISAGRQQGAVVPPRGAPATYGDIWEYHRTAIRLLRQFVDDDELAITQVALDALVSAIHPFLEYEAVRNDLFEVLISLPDDGLRRVRTEVTHLQGLLDRVSGIEARQVGLNLLKAKLPKPSKIDELTFLVYARSWDLEEGELQRRITSAAQSVISEQGSEALLALLTGELPAAFELGCSLAKLAPTDETLVALTSLAQEKNTSALVGYLSGLVDAGRKSAFDDFLDGESRLSLDVATRLAITVRGPKSPAGWRRVEQLNDELSVKEAVKGLFGWHIDIEPTRLVALIANWFDRIEDQDDYNAVIDFVSIALFKRQRWIGGLDDLIVRLVKLRSRFPDMRQESWDWVQLARRQLMRQPFALFTTILALIDGDALHVLNFDEEQKLLEEASLASGAQGWALLAGTIGSGSWRVQMEVRGWLLGQFPLDVITKWIANDVERAKLVASIADVGGDTLTPVARYLLEHFGDEAEVTSSLANTYITSSWGGYDSDSIAKQIAQLRVWAESASESERIRHWILRIINALEREREDSLLRQTEPDI